MSFICNELQIVFLMYNRYLIPGLVGTLRTHPLGHVTKNLKKNYKKISKTLFRHHFGTDKISIIRYSLEIILSKDKKTQFRNLNLLT